MGHARDVSAGERFRFGANWLLLLDNVTTERIAQAELALQRSLGLRSLDGKSFADLGSGVGLSSLAARNLGATVVSIDYDPQSVGCTSELKRRHRPVDKDWHVMEGSVLDSDFLSSLGRFDIVYSWGVLHHTGALWNALGNVAPLVNPNGTLLIAIYNDQGKHSQRWLRIKQLYNRLPRFCRPFLVLVCFVALWWRRIVKDALLGKPLHAWHTYHQRRGMSLWRDVVDWVGGYPFEVAKPEAIFRFMRDHGFTLVELHTNGGGLGCNEYVFRNTGGSTSSI